MSQKNNDRCADCKQPIHPLSDWKFNAEMQPVHRACGFTTELVAV